MPRFPLVVPREASPSLTAHIAFRGVSNPSMGTTSLYLDTGSTETIIGDQDKGLVEGFRQELKRSPRSLAGWGGAAEAYIIPGPNFVFLSDDREKPYTYDIGNLILGELQAYKKKRQKVQPIPSVLGTSFLRKLKAKVFLDYETFEGYIETASKGGM